MRVQVVFSALLSFVMMLAVAMADPRAEPSGILGVGLGAPVVIASPAIAGGWGAPAWGGPAWGARGLGVKTVGISGVGVGGSKLGRA